MASSQTASDSKTVFTVGSRASKLAVVQAEMVLDALQKIYSSPSTPNYTFTPSYVQTQGDKNQTQPLYLISGGIGKSLWTKELEVMLLSGEVDFIVHCLKDMPTTLPDGCKLGAIMEREDPVDSLVVKEGLPYKSLEELPDGSVVGTSSVRRVAQLRRTFPRLKFADVRGNLNTRLAKLDDPNGQFSALILAKAGLVRLGFGDRITSNVASPTLWYAVGQGALGIEIRSNDPITEEIVNKLIHKETELKCLSERSLLKVLEGGCSVPVGCETECVPIEGGNKWKLTLTGTVTSLMGDRHVVHTQTNEVTGTEDAEELGRVVARSLVEKGAKEILDEISRAKEQKLAEEAKADAAADAA